ncbi:MAG: prepilin peptidase [Nitrospirae bacterium]|nr:prepilin peptidase [Magnetococcales bacterium]
MNRVTNDYHRLNFITPKPLHTGLDRMVHAVVGRSVNHSRRPALLKNRVQGILTQAEGLRAISDARLDEIIRNLTTELRLHPGNEPLFDQGLACLVEIADRTLGMRPYPVQLTGVLVINQGQLAEMATGEGKTLTIGLASVLAGWRGRPCHVLTANGYLAQRDAETMAPLVQRCRLTIGSITDETPPEERRRTYAMSIVYTTSKDLMADFLKDSLTLRQNRQPQRHAINKLFMGAASADISLLLNGLATVIVDEADSLLIDEAVTPLIISAKRENPDLMDAIRQAGVIAHGLVAGRDFTVNDRYREVRLTALGEQRLEQATATLPPLWQAPGRREEIIRNALTVRLFFKRDQHYVIQGDKLVLLDEFTGRLMADRSLSAGLHQALELFEGLPGTPPTETMARLTFQKFFRMFRHLSGVSGTAREASGEFWHVYNLPVQPIPTHKPVARVMFPTLVFANKEKKWDGVIAAIVGMHQTGRPILVGTRSVDDSENLAQRLVVQGLTVEILNAVRHKEEARIVSGAGDIGRITIATNMAGRGTDITLTDACKALGGLHVIATELNESTRIDRQLFGRCSRQGDRGSAQAFISLEDELFVRFVPKFIQAIVTLMIKNPGPKMSWLVQKLFTFSQRKAQKLAYQRREAILRADTWLEENMNL